LRRLTYISVLGNSNSTAYAGTAGISTFPEYGPEPRYLNGRSLCRRPHCPGCAESAEAVVMHIDCFKLFVQRCQSEEAICRLWTATSWRAPWREAPDLRLEDATSTKMEPLLAERAGLARLALLPPEIVRTIHDHSASSLLWAYDSAIRLARQMSVVLPQDLVSVPLQGVAAWERCGSPLLAAQPRQTTIRLTIDVRGIRKIERLATRPSYQVWRSDHLVFVLVKDEDVADVVVHFKVRYPKPAKYIHPCTNE